MSSSLGDWDDLFALAQGKPTRSAQDEETTTSSIPFERAKPSTTSSSSRRPSKKARHSTGRAQFSSCSSSHATYLASRSIHSVELPVSLCYGPSLMEDPSNTCTKPSFSSKKSKATSPCKRCHASRFRHLLQPAAAVTSSGSSESEEATRLLLFCALRNLRHAAFLHAVRVHKEEKFDHAKSTILSLSAKLQEMEQQNRPLSRLLHQHSRLQSSMKRLLERIVMLPKKKTSGSSTWKVGLEEAIYLMMDCDTVYYELYYVEITQTPSSSTSTRAHFVPHPSFYFGESLSELGGAQRYCNEQIKDSGGSSSSTHSLLEARYWPRTADDNLPDPLTALHSLRLLETIQLFHLSGWLSNDDRAVEFQEAAARSRADNEGSNSTWYTVHETPAPPLLRAWRDSCRDFLTHLYAYATIPVSIQVKIQSFVGRQQQQQQPQGIVEVGAGTGYLASQLRRHFGLQMDAYDCHPGQQNKYHGSTPTFLPVKTGNGPKVVTAQHQEQQSPFVLLLCYPPPDSNMAVDTLRKFVQRGGRRLVHIGEFKGLTGTAAFESLLTSEFDCVKRFACPTWGTDAASVTFWEKTHHHKTEKKTSSTLLPCIMCQRESQKRLCYVRHLQYCSAACWQKHGKEDDLAKHLRMATVELGSPLPNFDDSNAFLRLGK